MAQPYSLKRMKALALALLLLAAGVYATATVLEPRHPAWAYVAAAAEAAMIGALADWFAVVALFRHPLGLPIPHTAIIVANKDRLGAQLARFLGEHFLSADQVGRALARWDLTGSLGRWMSRAEPAHQVAMWLQRATPALIDALDQTPARLWVTRLARRMLREVDLSVLGGQALQALTAHGHHQQWLDGLLVQLARWAEQDSVQERLTDAIAQEVRQLKYVGLDQVAARLATRKLVAALTRTLSDVAADPDHELRHRFDDWMKQSIDRLQTDPDWRARIAGWRDAWMAQPGWEAPIDAWWHDFLRTLREDAQRPDGPLVQRLTAVVQSIGEQLANDARLCGWLNQQVQTMLPQWLDASRETLVAFVEQRVQAWDADDMSRVLEQNIGRDLQFIRINGTLVGALVGLLLHALTQWALGLAVVQGWMQP